MRVIHAFLCQKVGQRRQRRAARVEIQILQDDHIGIRHSDHGHRGRHLRILPPQDIAQQKTRARARQLGVEGGDPERLGHSGQSQKAQPDNKDQARSGVSAETEATSRARRSRIMSAIRAMARPRMNMLNGKNIQSAIPQTIACGELSSCRSK